MTKNYLKITFCLVALTGLFLQPIPVTAQKYFPDKWKWETKKPEETGMDPQLIDQAIAYAIKNQRKDTKVLATVIWANWGMEPGFDILGPTKSRGDTNGMIIKDGYIIAEWGDTRRVDMTFSVTKSYLSTVAALALDRSLIHEVHDKVGLYVQDGKFDSAHNSTITWHHLLQQTSDWEGTLFGTPDWADRPVPQDQPELWSRRELHEPGTHMKYNDVRVNLLAYCLLQVWRRPLPQVLKEYIMDPIGASDTWRWHGYKNSWVTVDGIQIQSVSGGGHFGGGMFINTRDHARFGLLFARRGNWKGKQLFPEEWIDRLTTPADAAPAYGYMWWLNTDRKLMKDVPEHVYGGIGTGGNYIVVDEKSDLVVVLRWIGSGETLNGIMQRIFPSMEGITQTKYADFVGDYRFVLEGEEMLIKFYDEDGVLHGIGEYILGELKPVKGNDLKFKVETEYGENWSFEFIKDERGKIVKCRFTDEDFAETGSLTGAKVIKDAQEMRLDSPENYPPPIV
ncbi:serine hydrolase domain-containing protein [Acidobacteriota bacterium]